MTPHRDVAMIVHDACMLPAARVSRIITPALPVGVEGFLIA